MQRRLFPNTAALLAFDAVARSGSFTNAARELSLTQGAVSRQVAQLETQLGIRLLIRRARRTELTQAGQAYATRTRSALELLAQGALEAMGETQERGLKLAILPTFGTRWLMPRIPRFVRRHPDVTLHFSTRIGQFDLTAQGIDAAIHSGRDDWPHAKMTRLLDETVVPVAAPEHRGSSVASLPLLALNSRPQGWADWWRNAGYDGHPPPPSMRFEQIATLAQAAAAGMGVALLPSFLIRPELDDGTLIPLGDESRSGHGYFFVEPLHANSSAKQKSVGQLRDWLVTETDRETVV